MTQISPTTRATTNTAAPPRSPKTASNASLLPTPAAISCDPMLMLTKLTIEQRETDFQGRSRSAENAKKSRAEAYQAYEKAMDDAKKAREKSSFFGDLCGVLGKIGTVAAAIGAVASMVATGGASLPAVLALASVGMSGLATLNKEFKIVGGDVGDALNTALSVGSAVAGVGSAGTGLFNIGASAASTATEASRVAGYVGQGAQVGAAGTQGASAVSTGVAADYKHDEAMSNIDGERAASRGAKLDREQRRIADDARAIAQSYQASIDTMLATIGESQRTQQQLASAIRG